MFSLTACESQAQIISSIKAKDGNRVQRISSLPLFLFTEESQDKTFLKSIEIVLGSA